MFVFEEFLHIFFSFIIFFLSFFRAVKKKSRRSPSPSSQIVLERDEERKSETPFRANAHTFFARAALRYESEAHHGPGGDGRRDESRGPLSSEGGGKKDGTDERNRGTTRGSTTGKCQSLRKKITRTDC